MQMKESVKLRIIVTSDEPRKQQQQQPIYSDIYLDSQNDRDDGRFLVAWF